MRNSIATEVSYYPVGFGKKLAKILPLILSRLCCKASIKSKQRLLAFIVEVYSSEHKSKYEGIRELLQLLVDSIPNEQQIQIITELLDIPIPEYLDPITESKYLNPLLFLRIYEAPIRDRKSIPGDRISYYINNVKSNSEKVRDWAIFTLLFLIECNLLSDRQKSQFANAAWGETDSYGMPKNSSCLNHFWLHFQHCENFNVRHQMERYVSELEIPCQSESSDTEFTMGQIRRFSVIANELIGAQRSMQFDQQIYELWWKKIQFWWGNDRKFLRHLDPIVVEEFRTRFSFLIKIMSEFILPNLVISNRFKKDIELLVSDLQSNGIPTASVKAASIRPLEHNKEEIIIEIRKQLTESNRIAIKDALNAFWYAVHNKDEEFDVDERQKLVVIMLNAIIWGRNEVVDYALDAVSQVITNFPKLIDPEIERLTLLALDETAKYSEMENESTTMNLEERLSVRKESACLAYDFFLFYESKEREVPQEIIKWKSICESPKEFAEVRIQWKTS